MTNNDKKITTELYSIIAEIHAESDSLLKTPQKQWTAEISGRVSGLLAAVKIITNHIDKIIKTQKHG